MQNGVDWDSSLALIRNAKADEHYKAHAMVSNLDVENNMSNEYKFYTYLDFDWHLPVQAFGLVQV